MDNVTKCVCLSVCLCQKAFEATFFEDVTRVSQGCSKGLREMGVLLVFQGCIKGV